MEENTQPSIILITYVCFIRSHFGSNQLWFNFASRCLAFVMSSEDDVLLGPATPVEPSGASSDDNILLPGDHAGSGDGSPAREPSPLPMAGRLASWILVPPDEYVYPSRTVLGVATVSWNIGFFLFCFLISPPSPTLPSTMVSAVEMCRTPPFCSIS